MTCSRLACPAPASHRVRVSFLSGRVVTSDLCRPHATAMHSGLLASPQTASGSVTPLPAAASKRRVA